MGGCASKDDGTGTTTRDDDSSLPIAVLSGKQVGEPISLPPKHCSNPHPPAANVPFTVKDNNDGSKTIGKICDYCQKRQAPASSITKDGLMPMGKSNFCAGL